MRHHRSVAARLVRRAGYRVAVAALLATACGDPAAPKPVASVAPSAGRPVVLVGDTATLSAVVTDADGRTLRDRPLAWRVETPDLATVHDGRLVGVAPGWATVVATAEGVEGRLRIEIRSHPVASIRVEPAFVQMTVGDSVRLEITMHDAAGRVVPNRQPVPGLSSTSIVSLGPGGWLHARSGGVAQFSLAADRARTEVAVRVREEPLASISPVQRRLDLTTGARGFAQAIGHTVSGRKLALFPNAFASTDSSVLSLTGGGYVAVAPGTAEVVVAHDGVEARIPVVVTTPATGDFDVAVRWASAPTPTVEAALDSAIARWRRAVVGDLPDLHLALPDSACIEGAPALDEVVDDLLLWVRIDSIDGPGGVLGSAGPCVVRRGGLTAAGVVLLDRADAGPSWSGDLRLQRLLMHEIGHVLGIGTLWDDPSHLVGGDTADPRFVGPAARLAAGDMGFTAAEAAGIEIETEGGDGTAGGHWRESVYRGELMTGWLEMLVGAPLGAFTIGALADLGYEVRRSAAEHLAPPLPPPYFLTPSTLPPYPLGPSPRLDGGAARGEPLRDLPRRARFEVGPGGTVRRR